MKAIAYYTWAQEQPDGMFGERPVRQTDGYCDIEVKRLLAKKRGVR